MSKNKFPTGLLAFLCGVTFALGSVLGFFGLSYFKAQASDKLPSEKVVEADHNANDVDVSFGEAVTFTDGITVSDEIDFHFMMLGNKNTGDSIYIKAAGVDILIDAGSKTNSLSTIKGYVNQYVEDNKLEYVIVTHAHQDHYAGFTVSDGIFSSYEIGTIIDFSRSNNTGAKMYKSYTAQLEKAVENGATHTTAADMFTGGVPKTDGGHKLNEFKITDDIYFEVLYNVYYDTLSSDENNHSVCVMFHHGDRQYLFTGDLEKEGEAALVENNSLGNVTLYKAGHHGSKTSSNEVLLNAINPKICVVTCCCGNDEYTKTKANQFPTQAFIDRIAKFTPYVFVTTLGALDYLEGEDLNNKFGPMNGNIKVSSVNNEVNVRCSNNNTLLKDTVWMQNERTMPESWAA